MHDIIVAIVLGLVEGVPVPPASAPHQTAAPRPDIQRYELLIQPDLASRRLRLTATLAEGTGEPLDWWRREWLERGGVPELVWHADPRRWLLAKITAG